MNATKPYNRVRVIFCIYMAYVNILYIKILLCPNKTDNIVIAIKTFTRFLNFTTKNYL